MSMQIIKSLLEHSKQLLFNLQYKIIKHYKFCKLKNPLIGRNILHQRVMAIVLPFQLYLVVQFDAHN